MKKANHLAPFVNLLVILSLLSSIVCSYFNTGNTEPNKNEITITRKATSSASFIQLLSEGKEKEEENESDRNASTCLPLLFLITESLQFATASLPEHNVYNAPRSFGNATDIPLYLAKRTLLI